MEYKTNENIIQEVENLIDNSGFKKQFIAEQLGFTRQMLYKTINKKHTTFEDIAMIIDVLGYELHYQFVKKTDN